MSQIGRVLRLILTNGALLFACIIFASGFFPYKPFLPGLATFHNLDYGGYVPSAPFNKVIFMVVDALRRHVALHLSYFDRFSLTDVAISDFVFSHNSGFTFTQSLISNGSALPFTTYAAAPTVTMPRVKAITTGSIPSFLDMILNFAESDKSSSLATQDTWLAQMKAKENGKLIMYGDDTWLKLFPDFFARADGTSSFYVSDFTEVDNNVTRHVPEELKISDWNVMIMHYLGMDHIGHKGGPRSVNMLPKQQEMDGLVQEIYSALEQEPHLESTLFVMCGDHGMNDAGNHGGSAPGETSPALVFMSPRFNKMAKGVPCPTSPTSEFDFYDKVEQSDIAPTLAGLLGFPSPMNNLGVFIPQFQKLWQSREDHIQLMLNNALQILGIVRASSDHPVYDNPSISLRCSPHSADAELLACTWKDITQLLNKTQRTLSESDELLAALTKFCKMAQSTLSSAASNYDSQRLYGGIGLALVTLILCFSAIMKSLRLPRSASGMALLLICGLYAVMMFASSYVEEEQQFWYWATAGWFSLQFVRQYPGLYKLPWSASMICLVLLRILRRWNQSGQKWQGADDIKKFIQQKPTIFLWPLIFFTFQILGVELSHHVFEPPGFPPFAAFVASTTLTTIILLLKISQAFSHERWLLNGVDWAATLAGKVSSVLFARLEFCLLLLSVVYVIITRKLGRRLGSDINEGSVASSILPLISTFLVTETSSSGIPTFLLFNFLGKTLQRISLSSTELALGVILLSHCAFFAMGNTNAISSIDLSNAYNGITDYYPATVGILLFVGNWAGPLYWSLSGLILVLERSTRLASARMSTVPAITKKTKRPQKLNSTQADATKMENLGNRQQAALRNASTTTNSTMDPNFSTIQRKMTVDAWLTHAELLTFWCAIEIVAVLAACTFLRTHLFVWTVFSPKFLYVAAWFVGWHLCCNLLLGGLLAWAQ